MTARRNAKTRTRPRARKPGSTARHGTATEGAKGPRCEKPRALAPRTRAPPAIRSDHDWPGPFANARPFGVCGGGPDRPAPGRARAAGLDVGGPNSRRRRDDRDLAADRLSPAPASHIRPRAGAGGRSAADLDGMRRADDDASEEAVGFGTACSRRTGDRRLIECKVQSAWASC